MSEEPPNKGLKRTRSAQAMGASPLNPVLCGPSGERDSIWERRMRSERAYERGSARGRKLQRVAPGRAGIGPFARSRVGLGRRPVSSRGFVGQVTTGWLVPRGGCNLTGQGRRSRVAAEFNKALQRTSARRPVDSRARR